MPITPLATFTGSIMGFYYGVTGPRSRPEFASRRREKKLSRSTLPTFKTWNYFFLINTNAAFVFLVILPLRQRI